MTESIIVGILSLIGTGIGSWSGLKLMSYRIEQLEKRVNKHNSVIERTFILEEKVKVANNRIDDLEKEVRRF